MPEDPESEGCWVGPDQSAWEGAEQQELHFSRVKGDGDPPKLLPWLHVTENSAVLTLDPISFHDPLKCPDVILDQLLNPVITPTAVPVLFLNQHHQRHSVPPAGAWGPMTWMSAKILSRAQSRKSQSLKSYRWH